MPNPHNILSAREKNICEYCSTGGVMLSLTCLIQHFIFAIPGPLTNPMIPAYIFAIISFILLGLQKPVSIILLIISGIFSLIIEGIWMIHYAFSVVVVLLFIYHAVIIVFLFVEGMPKKLKMKRAAEKADRDMWAGKI